MARACPACGRPNNDAATRCLYCVEPLPGAESAPQETPAPTTPVSTARHLLILIPDRPDDRLVAELSRITGISLYDARLYLSSGRPRLFRFVDDDAEARRLSSELAAGGLGHYVVPEASVLALPVARASGIELRDRHFELRLEGKTRAHVSIPHADVILLVRGEIARERQDEKRLGSMRSVSRKLTPGQRLHLYSHDASLAIEIDPEHFDFRTLDWERSSSSVLNFEKLVARLSAATPDAELDTGFDYEPVVVSRSADGSDVTDQLAESDGAGPAGVLYDNEASFRFYARWRYRVARRLARREAG